MDYKQMTAPCGLDCFNCPLYMALDNPGLREKVAQNLGISEEKANCRGCKNEGGAIEAVGLLEPCSVFKCTSEKGLDFCYQCDEFPCDNLHPYADKADVVPHNTKVFNSCLINKMGLQEWAENKAKSVRDTYFKGSFKL